MNKSAKKTTLTAILACAWLPLQAEAAICRPFSDLGSKLVRCEDNLVLSESAMDCVDDYERDIQQGKAKIQKLLAAQVAAMQNKQNDSFDRSSASYQQVQQELTRLVADGEAAKSAVDGYDPELFLPEDYDQPQITGMSTQRYLDSEPCYAAPHTIVTGSSELIAKMLGDLKKTDLAALGKQLQSSDRSGKVQDISSAQGSAKSTYAKDKVPGKKGQSRDSQSDVTGIQDDLKKQQKGSH